MSATCQKKYIVFSLIFVTSILIIQSKKDIIPESLFSNESLTCHHDAQIVILVTSNAPNVKIRNSQRKAYPSNYLWDQFRAVRLFLVAQVMDEDVMTSISFEKDVILGNFQESYKHLSFKHIFGLSWAASR